MKYTEYCPNWRNLCQIAWLWLLFRLGVEKTECRGGPVCPPGWGWYSGKGGHTGPPLQF